MTRDDVIKLAREAGDDVEHTLPSDLDFLERFAALIAAQSAPDGVLKDAERYRFLEHLCATGTYRGIISRKAIDAAMLAAAPEAKP